MPLKIKIQHNNATKSLLFLCEFEHYRRKNSPLGKIYVQILEKKNLRAKYLFFLFLNVFHAIKYLLQHQLIVCSIESAC